MSDWEITFAAWSALIGITTTVFTGITAWAATSALSTWKLQRDSELAKKLAAAIYQYRQSLHRIRYPDSLPDDEALASSESVVTKDINFSRLLRWRHSRLKLQAVEALLSEADLHWSRQATDAFSEVLKVEAELVSAIQRLSVLAAREQDDSERMRAGHITADSWAERFDDRTPERLRLAAVLEDTFAASDEMRQKIDASFGRIEAFLRDRI